MMDNSFRFYKKYLWNQTIQNVTEKNEFSPLLLSPRQRWQFSNNNIMYTGLFYDNYSAIKDVQDKWEQK